MANIKVTYGSTARRLTISSTTTWSEIETQLRNLFSISQEIPINVSYTDEEGDIITLSSDLELQDALSNSFNNTGTIKFALTTPNENNLNNREKSIDTVVDEETSNLINGVSSIQIEEPKEPKESNKNKDKHVSISDEVDANIPLFNQQQYLLQETPGENSRKAAKSTDNNNNNNTQENNSSEGNQENSDDEPDIIIIIARNPWSHRRRERFGGCNPYYYGFGGGSRYGCHFDYNTNGCNRFASSRGYRCGRYNRRNQQISPEVVAEKINTLSSMGFVHDNLEELVRRYDGNLENIIEFLLFNKQNNEPNKPNNEKGENGQPMEVEEENRPYVL